MFFNVCNQQEFSKKAFKSFFSLSRSEVRESIEHIKAIHGTFSKSYFFFLKKECLEKVQCIARIL